MLRTTIPALAIKSMHEGSGTLATRKPMPVVATRGSLKARVEDCRVTAVVFQTRPRIVRFPDGVSFVPLTLLSIH